MVKIFIFHLMFSVQTCQRWGKSLCDIFSLFHSSWSSLGNGPGNDFFELIAFASEQV